MTTISLPHRDREFNIGLLLLGLSLAFFCYPALNPQDDLDTGTFILNYLFAVIYGCYLFGAGRLKEGRNGMTPIAVWLVLSLISCYSLNREMNIFETSADWWSIVLVICCVNQLILPFFRLLAAPLQLLVAGIAGVSVTVFTYLALYLLPYYPGSILVFFALGLSLHTFIPLLFVIYILVFIIRAGRKEQAILGARGRRRMIISFITGIAFSLAVIVQFIVRWQLAVRDINSNYATALNLDHSSSELSNNSLPAWVYVAQHCPANGITEKALKTGLVYAESQAWDFQWMPQRAFNEKRKHDPLVLMAAALYGKPSMTDEDKVKVLESMYDSRYQAQERFWSGDDLVTSHVSTHVQFWPKLHLSYTEENITVAQQPAQKRWNDQQEAIYTFHLPAGGVVSSLSLWIDGKEEKSVLTTRGKADTAYKTTVGVYQRDPSVVHWQEGNTVSVRVFPVSSKESRRFTIGITAPLEKDGQDLIYRSIYFDGPPATGASASVHIQPMQPLEGLRQPRRFMKKGQELEYSGDYDPDWELRFKDDGVENASFHFNGKQYTAEAWQPATAPASIREVYLDVNKSWTWEEFNALLSAAPVNSKVFAYNPDTGLIPVNGRNAYGVYHDLSTLQFSLFPLPLIKDKAVALLVSKSPAASPSIADLNGSGFSTQLQNNLALSSTEPVRLFNLGSQLSPYLKTLKECGAFQFEAGDMDTLKDHLRRQQFADDAAQEGVAVIDPAGILIRRSDWSSPVNPTPAMSTAEDNGPDHLLRLFAYRSIMRQLNGHLPDENSGQDSAAEEFLVNTAKEAHIVSPVSSLIVLEKQEDYDRFHITPNDKGLQNASLHSKGAVPEPGEWALIIGVIVVLGYIRFRRTKQSQPQSPI